MAGISSRIENTLWSVNLLIYGLLGVAVGRWREWLLKIEELLLKIAESFRTHAL
jgi:hypothetical protein